MSTQIAPTTVRSSIVVDAPIERAFSVFTDDIGSWWPPEHHILQAELAETVFEPREGGFVAQPSVFLWGRLGSVLDKPAHQRPALLSKPAQSADGSAPPFVLEIRRNSRLDQAVGCMHRPGKHQE